MSPPTPAHPVALITGGTRGIGLGVASALARSGFRLALTGRRPASEVESSLAELRSVSPEVLYTESDVADLAGHAGLVRGVTDRFGRLDLLVNNAGVAPEVRADILDASPESFDRLIGINLRGPYFLTQAVARAMAAQAPAPDGRRGRIVFITSISAAVASVNRGDYCLSKAGLSMAARLFAVRLAPHAIDVFEVRPGIIATDMTGPVQAKYDALIAGGLTLEKRWGTPDDIGKAVAALARGDLPYATGSVLTLDGGLTVPRL